MAKSDENLRQFEFGGIEFRLHADYPYELYYHSFGNCEGCRCEGSCKLEDVSNLFNWLANIVVPCMNTTIRYKGMELTREDIEEINRLAKQ